MTPYLLVFALLCAVLSYGLWYRRRWMWHAGWIMLYLFAGHFGHCFFTALIISETPTGIAYATIYLAGGSLVWLPVAIYWAKCRAQFLPSKPHKSDTPPQAST